MFLAYARVSTADQAKDNRTSMREQERICRGVAMTRGVPSSEIAIYTDAGISGTIALDKRPAGERLLQDVRPGDTVCASKLDRMFRDSLDAQTIYKRFKRDGVHLILFDLGSDPITSGGMSKLVYTILSAIADAERERIAERMQGGKAAKRARGGYVGGPAPYGWKIEGQGRDARLIRNEVEQEILAMAKKSFRAHASEIGQYAIVASELGRAGYTSRSGQPFQVVQVQRLIARAKQQ